MHLFDLFGRSRVKSSVPAARSPAVIRPRVAAKPAIARVLDTAPPEPHDLRRLILAAVASNDAERLATMFRDNADGIVVHAVDWMKVPDALRSNPAAVRWYGEGMRAVAQYCAERLNRPDLFQRLDELELSNPVVQ